MISNEFFSLETLVHLWMIQRDIPLARHRWLLLRLQDENNQ